MIDLHGAVGGDTAAVVDDDFDLGIEPRVEEHLFQRGAVVGAELEQAADQILTLARNVVRPLETDDGADYLVVLFEGNISAHHVVEQDAQRPHRRRHPVVFAVVDPFRR